MLKALSYVLPHSSTLSSSEWAAHKLRQGNRHHVSRPGLGGGLMLLIAAAILKSPRLPLRSVLPLCYYYYFFNTAQDNHGLSRADTMQWMITENLNMKVLVCLDSFGGHKALFLSSQGSPGFDRRPWNTGAFLADRSTQAGAILWRCNGIVMRRLIALSNKHLFGPHNTFICCAGSYFSRDERN